MKLLNFLKATGRSSKLKKLQGAATIPVTIATLVWGCQEPRPTPPSTTQAISNRPQNYDRFLAIIKLKTPPLLQTATKDPVSGLVKVDESLKASIEAEQAEALAQLAALSPEIKLIHRYRLVLNGLTIVAPKHLENQIRGISGISYVESSQNFARMETARLAEGVTPESIATQNSASFIGAYKVAQILTAKDAAGQDVPVDGRGLKVGVIDTGIDYTHSMLGGSGSLDVYKTQDKASLVDGGFPNSKVVGGYDFVGSEFHSGAPNFDLHIPKPDPDPLDEGGHGTHVAGTVSGIGNGTDTYNGVAVGASLYALKVFGAEGSTSDGVVIAALEYAADPNLDLNPQDRLDVVNLSLGSSFGTPHVLYNEAMANLTRADVVVVASAGNSGNKTSIVGAPSTADEVLSVAASIDSMVHNWQFRAVEFQIPGAAPIVTEAVESTVGKPISVDTPVSGSLVYLGTAATDLTEAQRQALAGKVALIDRGEIAFADKIRKASEAGATGVVVVNNQPGDPFTMGGDGSYNLPAIMVSQALGTEVKAALEKGPVTINFVTAHRVEKPDLIDTLTGFSSRGPRSIDGAIKPEIAAPGANIISAKMGGGSVAAKLSGTSMAAPHMAGVMALLKQKYPLLTVNQLKSLAVSTAATIKEKSGAVYPVAYAGAGRVQAFEAATAPLTFEPATISLGEVSLESRKSLRRTVTVSNISDQEITLTLGADIDPGLSVTFDQKITQGTGGLVLKPRSSVVLPMVIEVTIPASQPTAHFELDGFLTFKRPDGQSQKLPVLAVVNHLSRITAGELKVFSSSESDSQGAMATLTLENQGKAPGQAMLFNLLADDQRKQPADAGAIRTKVCDLESVGWRLAKGTSPQGFEQNFAEFAVKLYSPLTTWNLCEVSIQIDGDMDGKADQELLGTALNNISGNEAEVDTFVSALTDASKMFDIRRTYELQFPKIKTPNYSDAVQDKQSFINFAHSTLAVVRVDLAKLKLTPSGDLSIKVAVLGDPTNPDADDFLNDDFNQWRTLYLKGDQTFEGLADFTLPPGRTQTIELTKGVRPGQLLVYLPDNPVSWSPSVKDSQALTIPAVYQP